MSRRYFWCPVKDLDITNQKWFVIAQSTKQPTSLVIAVYFRLLCESEKPKEHCFKALTLEELAQSLDVTTNQVKLILVAMRGRIREKILWGVAFAKDHD